MNEPFRGKPRGIKPCRFRITLKVIRVIRILHMTPKVVYTFYRRLGCAGVNVG